MSGPSTSGSVVPTSAFPNVSALAKPVHFAAGSIRDLIVTALEIPEHLIDCKKGADICVAYAKYLALVDALDNLSTMSASGTWKHKNTNDDVIEVFVAKSVYFGGHAKVFLLLVHYPPMVQWLQDAVGAHADSVVWGNEKHSFDGLYNILTAKQNEKRKGKGKGKEVDGDHSSSLPIPVEKKANKKDKRKEVLQNKKASSSKGRHGHGHN
jgi:hypothetical protein